MLIDGRIIAGEILSQIGDGLRGRTLGVVMNENDPATQSFVKIKEKVAARLGVELRRFSAAQLPEALLCDGVIVQLPIENADELLAALPLEKDVDNKPRPPVAQAVAEILSRADVNPKGKKASVVGAGRLVGAPCAELLRELGAEVSIITQTRGSLEELKKADIVVLGAGEPGLIKPEMLKKGVVLIDAGTSESAGKLAGDADPACVSVASVFTPVPGGVGPIAVAMIFRNMFELSK